MPFQISALSPAQFEPLAALSAGELATHNARRMTVDKKPGFPCRVSLADAEMGEEVILVHYQHQDAATPFRSSHAVYFRPGVEQALPAVDEVPVMLRSRPLSIRAFDDEGMMVGAELADGTQLEAAIAAALANPKAAYLHLHFAKPGCYAARVDRA